MSTHRIFAFSAELNMVSAKPNKDSIFSKNVISSFQKVGNVSGGILKSSKFIYFSIGFIVMVFMLLLMKLNTFLDKYNK